MERCGREWTTGRAQESSGKKRGPLPLACMANKGSGGGGGGGGPSLNSGETVFPDPRRRRSKTWKKEREGEYQVFPAPLTFPIVGGKEGEIRGMGNGKKSFSSSSSLLFRLSSST